MHRTLPRVARRRAYAVLATITVLAAVTVLAAGCSSGSTPPPPVSLPVPKTGEITFYLSLPASTAGLEQAAENESAPLLDKGTLTTRARADFAGKIQIIISNGRWFLPLARLVKHGGSTAK